MLLATQVKTVVSQRNALSTEAQTTNTLNMSVGKEKRKIIDIIMNTQGQDRCDNRCAHRGRTGEITHRSAAERGLANVSNLEKPGHLCKIL